ncbi:MAG: nitrate reductase subunit alpha [Actinomycetia bacterium]|nr:nitrate reductase subunit alpha [Actinomycetes bacterium]
MSNLGSATGKRPGLDDPLTEALLRAGRHLRPGTASADLRAVHQVGGRDADVFYRDRWSYDKVVRSTHGVNCTGSCSWKVYVKDGIITWEAQQTDYPSVGPDRPEYEPRGCPRGASFSWYTYSPTRVRYPYVRGALLEMFRAAKARHNGDPVLAWEEIVSTPELRRRYVSARGKGGLVRANWEEAAEIVAAAQVRTIKKYGPDRVAGFSPIPAMSIVSHAIGFRYHTLIGAPVLSFYDWYCDLPVGSPQVFGDQTDVPESGDWWDAGYLIMWGSNVPVTRTPDAHWMAEARYRGQKVVVVSPDYADNVKFADEWLAGQPGTDAALAISMGHVILTEFYRDRQVPYFTDYVSRFTDLPFLVKLRELEDGSHAVGKFLTAADLPSLDGGENAAFKTVLIDSVTDQPVVPNGSLGFRFGEQGAGKWNLELGEVKPRLSLYGTDGAQAVEVSLPRYDNPSGDGALIRRGVPARELDGQLVTTVFDLMMANYGVGRDGLPGQWPTGYDDASQPGTPAWQEEITGVPAAAAARVGREFAANAEATNGRSMILMGAATNHYYHSDLIYRTFLALITMTGCQGVNGGGWGHYVGQEKVRPVTGHSTLAQSVDWQRPPRTMVSAAYFFLATDQWRYDTTDSSHLASPLAAGRFTGQTQADLVATSARLGWMPSYPTFNRNPLDLADDIAASGKEPGPFLREEIRAGRIGFAAEDPDAEENWPRVLTVWRSNLLGSSAKGDEYFLRHLIGSADSLRAKETPEGARPASVRWRDQAPAGKLDLLLSLDFRMTSTTLFSDVILPAATWYEKHDISTTDMHPFVHAFSAAIAPPWETRSDFDAFHTIARRFSELAATHLGERTDLVAMPLLHDTPDELATPHGVVADWRDEGVELTPGVNFPKLIPVKRDYAAIADKLGALGPLADSLGQAVKGLNFDLKESVAFLAAKNGVVRGGAADGRPSLGTDIKMAEAILAMSGTTNGALAVQGFKTMEKRTGTKLADLAEENEGKQITFADTQSRPVPVITSPEWSGSETGGRRYSPFVINVERAKPWHTLTGRQHFLLDHDWMIELGEQLPLFRPPLDMTRLFHEPAIGNVGPGDFPGVGVTVRFLTPHNKWSVHSEYQDNLYMLTLSRGGSHIWISPADAAKVGVADNDWIEAVNRNGVIVARAIVSSKMPEGTVYMYHAQDRVVDVPIAETSGKRGGIHNSGTRVLVKPSHIIGGYAQLSYAFNYLGPTGNQRDEVTTIRRRSQEVGY